MDTNELNEPTVQVIKLEPEFRLILSKFNAKTYLETIKNHVKNTGFGLLEFVETLKFFEKVKEIISGNSQSKNPEEQEGDKEFKQMVIDAITPYGKNGYTTTRGAKFALMEAGHKYHYENCNDPVLANLIEEVNALTEQLKARQEFLKTVPGEGMEIHIGEGELITIYPPYKTSTSTYKVTLPR